MDFALSGEQRRLREMARGFALERIRPVAASLDAEVDPADTFPTALVREASELGLRTMSLPPELGGLGSDPLTETIVLEELCYGDAGFGMTMAHPWRELRALLEFGTDDQRERLLPEMVADPTALTALALTEEHFGSDKALPYTGDGAGPRTTARLEGDTWVLNGRKRWITNGNVAKLVFVLARTDATVPWNQGVSLFLVPAGTDGMRTGVVEDKLGLRLNQNAEIVFEDCAVPAGNLLGHRDDASRILRSFGPVSKAKEGAKCIGIGRAALEAGRVWAAQRVQGGVPIGQHQAVGTSLAELATELEAARTFVWRAAWAAQGHSPDADALGNMAVVLASRTVVRIALRCLELHGGAGIRRGSAAERQLRNAVTMLHAPAGNDALLARIDRLIADGGERLFD